MPTGKKIEMKEEQIKVCETCGTLKVSSPTPDGDDICPSCGDMEMMDAEDCFCVYDNKSQATHQCGCGKYLCKICGYTVNGKSYCNECYKKGDYLCLQERR